MNLQTLESVLAKDTFSDEELLAFLSLTDAECCSRLWREAYDRTTRVHGNALWFRGLIEISNYCIYDCRYCGIRKGNRLAQRYTLTPEEIVEAARYAVRAGYGSVALQAGERTDEKFIAFVEDVLRRIHRMSVKEGIAEGCGVTLSFGEQTEETYERWAQAAGNRKALRYLLRIETSNLKLFNYLHSGKGGAQKTWPARLEALATLRKLGYQVGTGVMIGIPGQSLEDLVRDIRTFEELDADMLGMGPYLVSHGGDMVADGTKRCAPHAHSQHARRNAPGASHRQYGCRHSPGNAGHRRPVAWCSLRLQRDHAQRHAATYARKLSALRQ